MSSLRLVLSILCMLAVTINGAEPRAAARECPSGGAEPREAGCCSTASDHGGVNDSDHDTTPADPDCNTCPSCKCLPQTMTVQQPDVRLSLAIMGREALPPARAIASIGSLPSVPPPRA